MNYSIYCDESCHLEADNSNVMVLGCVWCPKDKAREINRRINEIATSRGQYKKQEFKWTKISPNHYREYRELIDFFFDDDDIQFRAVVIPNKLKLDHKKFSQSHDEWYYKMLFLLIKNILTQDNGYHIFLDYKDTQGGLRIRKLQEVLSNSQYDYSQSIVKQIQLVQSFEVGLIQLADVLTGAIGYANRNLDTNSGKNAIVSRIKERSRKNLIQSTLPSEPKVNILVWNAQEGC
jgi:hypothetical protein